MSAKIYKFEVTIGDAKRKTKFILNATTWHSCLIRIRLEKGISEKFITAIKRQ